MHIDFNVPALWAWAIIQIVTCIILIVVSYIIRMTWKGRKAVLAMAKEATETFDDDFKLQERFYEGYINSSFTFLRNMTNYENPHRDRIHSAYYALQVMNDMQVIKARGYFDISKLPTKPGQPDRFGVTWHPHEKSSK